MRFSNQNAFRRNQIANGASIQWRNKPETCNCVEECLSALNHVLMLKKYVRNKLNIFLYVFQRHYADECDHPLA